MHKTRAAVELSISSNKKELYFFDFFYCLQLFYVFSVNPAAEETSPENQLDRSKRKFYSMILTVVHKCSSGNISLLQTQTKLFFLFPMNCRKFYFHWRTIVCLPPCKKLIAMSMTYLDIHNQVVRTCYSMQFVPKYFLNRSLKIYILYPSDYITCRAGAASKQYRETCHLPILPP